MIPTSVLADLAEHVHVTFGPAGQVLGLDLLPNRQLARLFDTVGGKNLSVDVDTLRQEFNAYVFEQLPRWAAARTPPLGRDAMAKEIMMQQAAAGRYAGPLYHGRYQILEHVVLTGQFTILDHELLGPDWRDDWKATLNRPTSGQGRPEPELFSSVEAAKERLAELVAGAVAKPTRKQPAAAPLAAPAAPTPGRRTLAAPAAPTPGRRTLASVLRAGLLAGGQTDDQLFEAVAAEFPTARRSSVDWYRKELIEKGQLKA